MGDKHDLTSTRTVEQPGASPALVGVVVIGRNEAERLPTGLAAVKSLGLPVVFVDSDSSDGSAEIAEKAGAFVVRLGPSDALTAARARNEGFDRLRREVPSVRFVQFVDGDCVLCREWISGALRTMHEMPTLGAVCGRLAELGRERSIYRRVLDMEWDRPLGDIATCGGVFMVRVEVFEGVNGFDPTSPFGEEAEFFARVRSNGWRIARLSAPMALHDSGIDSFGPWIRRAARGGAAALRAARPTLGGRQPGAMRRIVGILVWGALPFLALAGGAAFALSGSTVVGWVSVAAGGALVAQLSRILLRAPDRWRRGDRLLYAASCVAAKPAELLGVLGGLVWRGGRSALG